MHRLLGFVALGGLLLLFGCGERTETASPSVETPQSTPPTRIGSDPDPELVKQGELVYNKQACGTCHMNPKSVIKAPDLNGLYMSQVELTDGRTITADEEYLRTAIVEPSKHLVKGYQNMMPPYKQLSEKELDALVAYLISLK